MSPKGKVQGPLFAAEDACGVLPPAGPGNAAPDSQPVPVCPHRPTARRRPAPAFTLIEIMIVIAIMGIVMAMGVPIVYKMWRRAPMRQAVKDIVEVCSNARARAILQGHVTQVVFHPKQNRLEYVGGGAAPPPAAAPGSDVPGTPPAASGSGLSAQLPPEIIIETLDINMSGVEFNDVESARVRFYPNGVSDEMRMIVFDGRERMGIELEITTGLANVVRDPLREWSRR